jgi:hypothetical protein
MHDRIFLAGDSLHTHSPKAGQELTSTKIVRILNADIHSLASLWRMRMEGVARKEDEWSGIYHVSPQIPLPPGVIMRSGSYSQFRLEEENQQRWVMVFLQLRGNGSG